jgi:hypothetical protein
LPSRQQDSCAQRLRCHKAEGLDLLALDESPIHTVFAVHELNEISKRVTYRAIAVNHDIAQHLDKTTLVNILHHDLDTVEIPGLSGVSASTQRPEPHWRNV